MTYQGEEGEIVFDFDKEKETIWATQEEISKIFGVDRTVVTRHLRNIFKSGELSEERTCVKNAHVGIEGGRKVKRTIKLYNLDAIISVGYRVNSKNATKFRVWATGVLKKYMVDGAAVNQRRIGEVSEDKLKELEATLGIVRRLMKKTELEEGEAKGILEVISKYGATVKTINEFEQGRIPAFLGKVGRMRKNLSIGEVKNLAENLREETAARGGFGEIKDEGEMEKFLGSLATDEQGRTVAEKAARLLYYIVNEEPFREGNGQIGALVFIYFLTINDFHLAENGETKISDKALTAIVLLISESDEEDREMIIGVVRKLLEG